MRNDYLDNLKGVLIVLVVLLHFYSGYSPAFTVLGFSNMPLFLIVSGYFFWFSLNKADDDLQCVIKRCKSLIIPIITFGLFNYLAYSFFNSFSINKIAYCFVNTGLWFLYNIILNSIVITVVRRISKKISFQLAGCVLVYIILCCVYIYIPLFRTEAAFFPYFAFGYFYNALSNYANMLRIKRILGFVCVLLFPYMIIKRIQFDIYEVGFVNVIYGLEASLFFEFLFKNSGLFNKRNKVLSFLGRNSLEIYYVHLLLAQIVALAGMNLREIMIINDVFSTYIVSFITTIIVTAISCAVFEVINLSPLLAKVLFGRTRSSF